MFSLKSKLAVIVVVCLVIGVSLFTALPSGTAAGSGSGRLLSDREMTATVGDLAGNLLCIYKGRCEANRVGTVATKPACISCQPNTTGIIWFFCCPTADTTKECTVTSNNFPCGGIPEVYDGGQGYQTQNDCVNPCFLNGGVNWVPTGAKCTTREDATGPVASVCS